MGLFSLPRLIFAAPVELKFGENVHILANLSAGGARIVAADLELEGGEELRQLPAQLSCLTQLTRLFLAGSGIGSACHSSCWSLT